MRVQVYSLILGACLVQARGATGGYPSGFASYNPFGPAGLASGYGRARLREPTADSPENSPTRASSAAARPVSRHAAEDLPQNSRTSAGEGPKDRPHSRYGEPLAANARTGPHTPHSPKRGSGEASPLDWPRQRWPTGHDPPATHVRGSSSHGLLSQAQSTSRGDPWAADDDAARASPRQYPSRDAARVARIGHQLDAHGALYTHTFHRQFPTGAAHPTLPGAKWAAVRAEGRRLSILHEPGLTSAEKARLLGMSQAALEMNRGRLGASQAALAAEARQDWRAHLGGSRFTSGARERAATENLGAGMAVDYLKKFHGGVGHVVEGGTFEQGGGPKAPAHVPGLDRPPPSKEELFQKSEGSRRSGEGRTAGVQSGGGLL